MTSKQEDFQRAQYAWIKARRDLELAARNLRPGNPQFKALHEIFNEACREYERCQRALSNPSDT